MFTRYRDKLIIVKKKYVDSEFVDAFENFHNNFPNVVCYVEDDDEKIVGIFSWREYKQSSYFETVMINSQFTYVTENDDAFIEHFHAEHSGFLNVPYILDGRVEAEYCFSKNEWVSEEFEWHLIGDNVINCVLSNHVNGGKVWVSDENIRARVDGSLLSLGPDASLRILDMPGYYMEMKKQFEFGTYVIENVLSEYNLYIECLILQMMEEFEKQNIRVRYFGVPNGTKIEHMSERDRELVRHPQSINWLIESGEIDRLYCDYPDSLEFMKNRMFEKTGFHFMNGHYIPTDISSPVYNIVSGIRNTDAIPVKAKYTIYVYGICMARGVFCADTDTVESFLQRKINESEDEWEVVNCGVAEGIIGAALNDFQYVLHSEYKTNDIVVFLSEYDQYTMTILKRYGVEVYETSELFENREGLERWFLDIMPHATPMANKLVADYIYQTVSRDFQNLMPAEVRVSVAKKVEWHDLPDGIEAYVDEIRNDLEEQSVYNGNKIIGSIVMNCNPFTNGHQYLIEQAKKKCDELLIFVVMEDRSRFRFEDRFAMVSECSKTIGGGIHIFPSGRFMISQETFPEYFYKDEIQEKTIDTTYDVNIFAKFIAPKLGIGIRFVGEEPTDKVTESYNRTMERILTLNGIGFCEIPRACDDEGFISATRVRKCIDDADLEGLKGLVPEKSFEIIVEKYMDTCEKY